ncbi:DNA repair protein RecO [Porticoccaceae bacterium]|jgi:DNA repair protein RecO (recombination protein O)|nr:DNA repair protein RecO [Porticoccaceae bacterium]MDA9014323.1 DNA repair protein RecO [Porticoccaceae bacterium]
MRVESEPGFILHTIPYRETSLLVDIFTLNYGRLRCVAKGFRKPNKKGIAKTLFPYTEHHFQWQGRGELKTLIQADPIQSPVFLAQESLFIGLYINELLYKLLHQNDPHQSLYQFYQQLMTQLACLKIEQPTLRNFEMLLLEELGYGLVLDADAETGQAVNPEHLYYYIPDQGLKLLQDQTADSSQALLGADIMALTKGDFEQPSVLRAAKQLTRQVIDFYLDGKELNSRELYRQHLLNNN